MRSITSSSVRPVFGSAFALSGLLAAYSALGSVTINTSDPTIYTTAALAGATTLGDMMDGMEVSVSYSSGSSPVTAIWADNGASAGKAESAGNFRLSITGDTYDQLWTLENLRGTGLGDITEFSINARLGLTVFDIVTSPETTTGSDVGTPFAFGAGSSTYNALVDYSDALKLDANANPLHDLFLRIRVRLTDGTTTTHLAAGSSLSFYQDTDNSAANAIIEEVPEASTYAAGLALVGLTGYGFLRRRQVAKK